MTYAPITPNIPVFELEFRAVGDNSKSGDAIVVSWLDGTGQRHVVIVDGGYKTDGEQLVDLIHGRFRTDVVDLVISTHPDAHHANGLLPVVENLAVAKLLMHKPWEHVGGLDLYSGRFAAATLEAQVKRSLDAVKVLAEAAYERDIEIVEPFAGQSYCDGVVTILGPTEEYYEELLPEFRCMTSLAATASGSVAQMVRKASAVGTRLLESLSIETLTDAGTTSAENNSSAIVQFTFNGERFVLTGDAGIPALHRAADHVDAMGLDPESLRLIQVPHHGSNENVGPDVLDRLLGQRIGMDLQTRYGIVSAAVNGEECGHPSRQVTNAFRRRGTPVYATQGVSLRYAHNAELPGYSPAAPLPLYTEVES